MYFQSLMYWTSGMINNDCICTFNYLPWFWPNMFLLMTSYQSEVKRRSLGTSSISKVNRASNVSYCNVSCLSNIHISF